ncbi:MAG: peptidylprolyl isomerase [Stenomitos rutilans HA7619-LM2]|jgi:peptidyl-prolyl cis-trans isomerase B (cyclophilin B)|nr:peptidylprolyl isomerase [Stenomitos rutilans HA7619-LM2]
MVRTLRQWLALVVVTSAIVLGGCLPQSGEQSSAANPSPTQTASSPVVQASSSPQASDIPRLEGKATVAIVVKGGTITAELDGTNAPVTAGNFVDLVQRGVYNGLVFHRVVREPQPFVVQGGDPQSKNPNFPPEQLGTGSFVNPATGQPRYVPLEITPVGAKSPVYHQTFEMAGVSAKPKLTHKRGALAMARSQPPDSASSQFYITLADVNFLDGNYAVFGYVTQGMETVDKIQQGDRIESAKVVKGLENLKKG